MSKFRDGVNMVTLTTDHYESLVAKATVVDQLRADVLEKLEAGMRFDYDLFDGDTLLVMLGLSAYKTHLEHAKLTDTEPKLSVPADTVEEA